MQRLDKWLWFARVVKTRELAQTLVEEGGIRIGGQRIVKCSKEVKIGDVLTIALPSRLRVLKVIGFAERRGDAMSALMLYDELIEPLKDDLP